MIGEIIKKNILRATETGFNTEFFIGDNDFCIMSYDNGKELHVWAEGGRTSLYYSSTNSAESTMNIVEKRIKDCLGGYIHCSDCGEMFPKEEVKRYKRVCFAGRYCQHCWDTKWKDFEANMNYD